MRDLDARLRLRERPRDLAVMRQQWRHLLFLHWKFPPDLVQRTLPPGLFVDTFEGAAWAGVIPFAMHGVRPPGCPPIPGISNFLELNIRTYAHDGKGNYGVWFYSLEANSRLAVWGARRFFHLNYIFAKMQMYESLGGIHYSSRREEGETQNFHYRGIGAKRRAEPGSLEFFLIERYLLFSCNPRTRAIHHGRVHHAPYLISNAHVETSNAWGLEAAGLPRPSQPGESLLYSPGVDVEAFSLKA